MGVRARPSALVLSTWSRAAKKLVGSSSSLSLPLSSAADLLQRARRPTSFSCVRAATSSWFRTATSPAASGRVRGHRSNAKASATREFGSPPEGAGGCVAWRAVIWASSAAASRMDAVVAAASSAASFALAA